MNMKTPSILRERRLGLGLSQTEVARRVSVALGYTQKRDYYNQSTVARWESFGPLGRPVTAEVLPAVAKVLGLDILALLGGDPKAATCPVTALETYSGVILEVVQERGKVTLTDPNTGAKVFAMRRLT